MELDISEKMVLEVEHLFKSSPRNDVAWVEEHALCRYNLGKP